MKKSFAPGKIEKVRKKIVGRGRGEVIGTQEIYLREITNNETQ